MENEEIALPSWAWMKTFCGNDKAAQRKELSAEIDNFVNCCDTQNPVVANLLNYLEHSDPDFEQLIKGRRFNNNYLKQKTQIEH